MLQSCVLAPMTTKRAAGAATIAGLIAGLALTQVACATTPRPSAVAPSFTTTRPTGLKAVGPSQTTCQPFGTFATHRGEYTIQANEWNSTARQCVTYRGGTSWSVDANFNLPTNGAPAAYPSIYKGCHWGRCTASSGLPVQVSHLTTAQSTWATQQPSQGAYDVAYDLWFNSTPTTTGQPDGTELMVWLNSRGGVQPFGTEIGTTTVSGVEYNVWVGNGGWNVITYQMTQGLTCVTDLDVKALIDNATSRGQINPDHYLIAAEAGFEIWQGGSGLATNNFSFYAR